MKTLLVLLVTLACLVGCEKSSTPQEATVKPDVWLIPQNPTVEASGQRTMVIVFDASLSMGENNKLAQAKKATRLYVSNLPPDVSVGLIAFAGSTKKMADIGTDRLAFRVALDSITLESETLLGKAVGEAYELLAERAKALQGQGEYHMVIVTDGDAQDIPLLKKNVSEIVTRSPIQIFTIGFGIGNSHVLNTPGPQIRYVAAENEAEIGQGLKKVLAEVPEPVQLSTQPAMEP